MQRNEHSRERSWAEKFRDAFRGLKQGVRGQISFFAHFFMAAAVIAAAVVLKVRSQAEWCLLLLCITLVLCAEMFNSALESLARAITDEADPHVAVALNIGSAAVLLASVGAAVVGTIILLNRLALLVGWW
ncbi:MAG: hypothetical protein A2V70_08710 [Planctomycetes bacterium RBG_13_63_9]|nr:MAG: hypothetical protein A2V70_08710 [Planctomycetes bacterium RBG_13_63_9]